MRQKKYVMLTQLSVDILSMLEKNNKLYSSTYKLTTSGGKNILWEVHTKDKTFFTVSTESLRIIKVNNFIRVPEYQHYVLNEEGMKLIKEQVVEQNI